MLTVDTREDVSYWLSKLSGKSAALPAGDFLVEGENVRYIIERKTASDFANSLLSGRLWTQLKNMKNSDAQPILLIEGSLAQPRKWSRIHVSSLCGALASVIHDWQTPVVTLPRQSWTVVFLRALSKRLGEPRRPHRLRVSPKAALTLREKQLYFLEGLPAVGAATSRAILEVYGSPLNFFLDIENARQKLPRLTRKAQKQIIQVLTASTTNHF